MFSPKDWRGWIDASRRCERASPIISCPVETFFVAIQLARAVPKTGGDCDGRPGTERPSRLSSDWDYAKYDHAAWGWRTTLVQPLSRLSKCLYALGASSSESSCEMMTDGF